MTIYGTLVLMILMISLPTFNDFCRNVLQVIGGGLISLRLRLSNSIDGWSLVSSSLQHYQFTLLQRLILIGSNVHSLEFAISSSVTLNEI